MFVYVPGLSPELQFVICVFYIMHVVIFDRDNTAEENKLTDNEKKRKKLIATHDLNVDEEMIEETSEEIIEESIEELIEEGRNIKIIN